jgi:hypothetical protein
MLGVVVEPPPHDPEVAFAVEPPASTTKAKTDVARKRTRDDGTLETATRRRGNRYATPLVDVEGSPSALNLELVSDEA